MSSAPRFNRWMCASLPLLFSFCCWPGAVSAAEMLRYAGATTLQRDFMPEAAALFAAESGIQISIAGGNTDPGIKAVQTGTIDLAGSGRRLSPAERKLGLREVQVGWDPLAVVVHRSNPVSDLTPEQLKGIFSGTTRNWKELGGRDEPIVLVNGPQDSGMYAAIRDLILDGENPTSQAIVSPVVAEGDQMVARMSGAIGAISKSMIDISEVKLLGIAGTRVGDAGYPLQKPLFLVTRARPSGAVQRFVAFALGPEGQKIVAKKFLPVKLP